MSVLDPARPGIWSARPHRQPEHYLRLLRTARYRWWMPLLGLPLALLTWIVLTALLGGGLIGVGVLASRQSFDEVLDTVAEGSGPAGLLFVNVVLASLIPAVMLAVVAVHGERVGWLSSVLSRLRWLWLLGFVGLAILFVGANLALSLLLSVVLPADVAGEHLEGVPDPPALPVFIAYALVILLTTPLQAAGEEYAFRGYLGQVLGAWVRWPWVSMVVTSLLFGLAHGPQDPWLFADRFGFGLAAAWVAWRTGGLEAPIALHAVNNVLGMLLAAAFGDLEESLVASAAPWPMVVLDLAMVAGFAALAVWLVRRFGGEAAGRSPVMIDRPLAGPHRPLLGEEPALGYPARSSRPAAAPGDWGMG